VGRLVIAWTVSVCAGLPATDRRRVIRRRPLTGGSARTETAYAITDLPTHQAGPAHLADLVRQH
jgi:hypothetical protein